jgi:hypothetical protein
MKAESAEKGVPVSKSTKVILVWVVVAMVVALFLSGAIQVHVLW